MCSGYILLTRVSSNSCYLWLQLQLEMPTQDQIAADIVTLSEVYNLMRNTNNNQQQALLLQNTLRDQRMQALADADAALQQAQSSQIEFLRAGKRGNELYTAQTELLSAHIHDRVEADVGTTRRQFEINEYYYNKKLDTLFMLQIAYIALLICALPIAGLVMGGMTAGTALVWVTVVGVFTAGVILYRWYYTRYVRDRNFWSRRYFSSPTPAAHPVPAAPSCPTSTQ